MAGDIHPLPHPNMSGSHAPRPENLHFGGGGGNSGDMEARITRLEGRIDGLDDRLRGVEVSLATLSERVRHLPSKGFIVSVTLTAFALLSGVVIFADNIRAMIAQ